MLQKSFLLFYIAAISAITVSTGILSWLAYDMIYQNSWSWNDWFFLIVFFFSFSSSIFFQLTNLRLVYFLKKVEEPAIWLKHWNLLLLVVNSIGGCLLLWGIYDISQEMLHDNEPLHFHQICIYVGLIVLTLATITTIILSLRLRKYLRQQLEAKQENVIESLGQS